MYPISPTTFLEWQDQQQADPNFVAAANTLEIGYQFTRLRIQRGLTQSQLAEMAGTRQPSIARLENGTSVPSLSFLDPYRQGAGCPDRTTHRPASLKQIQNKSIARA